jgi:antitoxin HicB
MLFRRIGTMSALEYRIEIQPLPASEGGGYFVTVPDLPGCMADGDTQEQALENILSAIDEWKARARALGRAIPKPTYPKQKLSA